MNVILFLYLRRSVTLLDAGQEDEEDEEAEQGEQASTEDQPPEMRGISVDSVFVKPMDIDGGGLPD